MSPSKRGRSRSLRGDEGLIAIYRPFFQGDGRSITLQALTAFAGGFAEAALLVLVAKLAFSIGSGEGTVEGLGPLSGFKITIPQMFVGAVVLVLLRGVLQGLSAHLTAALVTRRMSILRADTFRDYAMASWSVQSSLDEGAVQDLLVRYVSKLISAVLMIASVFTALFALLAMLISAVLVDPLSAVLVVVAGAVLFAVLRPLSVVARRYAQLQVAAGRRYVEESLEAIGLSLEIRAFGVNKRVAESLAEATKDESKPIYVSQFLGRFVSAIYQLFALAIVLLGLYCVYAFLDRPVASLGAIVVILVRSMNQASNLQSAYHTAVEAAPFAQDLTSQRQVFRDSAPASGTVQPPERGSLVFEDVSYAYSTADEAPNALDGVSFDIQAGEAIGVIGPSGSGKSTLIQLLLRLREPTRGRYLIGGVDTREIDENAWFKQIAFVPQDCRTVNTNIMENIRFYRSELSDDDVIDAAKRAHLHAEIIAMPEGYQTELGSRGGSLSGGQRQRVAIARALAGSPQILVLDEPTSALDMRSEALVHQTLTDLQGEVTLVIIAHRLSTLKTCDRIMVYGEGKLQEFGERGELEVRSAFYRDAIALSKLRS